VILQPQGTILPGVCDSWRTDHKLPLETGAACAGRNGSWKVSLSGKVSLVQKHMERLLPYTPILLLPLLLWNFFDPNASSLLPHDEALYVWRARLFLHSGELWTPFPEAHHKTPGFYWLIALSLKLFGLSDAAARLPSVLLALTSAQLVFHIGAILLSPLASAMAVLVLGTSYLWAVHSRIVSPDMAYTTCFLGGTLLLLQVLDSSRTNTIKLGKASANWRLWLAGLLFALTVFLRSALACLPLLGLMPWLLTHRHGRQCLANPWLYLGLACGALPTVIWLWKTMSTYQGMAGLLAPLTFPLRKAVGGALQNTGAFCTLPQFSSISAPGHCSYLLLLLASWAGSKGLPAAIGHKATTGSGCWS